MFSKVVMVRVSYGSTGSRGSMVDMKLELIRVS